MFEVNGDTIDVQNDSAGMLDEPKLIDTGNISIEQPKASCHLPISRVKKIMKSDPDVNLCSNEAVLLVASATELFISAFAERAFEETNRNKSKTINYKDLASVVRNVDHFEFLADIIPDKLHIRKAFEKRANIQELLGVTQKAHSTDISFSENLPIAPEQIDVNSKQIADADQ